jgi:pilus assembly protein Flp/PilA
MAADLACLVRGHSHIQESTMNEQAPSPQPCEDERGASAVEYGLLVAGIAAVIVAAVFLFGQGVFSELFQNTCDSIAQNMPGGCE